MTVTPSTEPKAHTQSPSPWFRICLRHQDLACALPLSSPYLRLVVIESVTSLLTALVGAGLFPCVFRAWPSCFLALWMRALSSALASPVQTGREGRCQLRVWPQRVWPLRVPGLV